MLHTFLILRLLQGQFSLSNFGIISRGPVCALSLLPIDVCRLALAGSISDLG